MFFYCCRGGGGGGAFGSQRSWSVKYCSSTSHTLSVSDELASEHHDGPPSEHEALTLIPDEVAAKPEKRDGETEDAEAADGPVRVSIN